MTDKAILLIITVILADLPESIVPLLDANRLSVLKVLDGLEDGGFTLVSRCSSPSLLWPPDDAIIVHPAEDFLEVWNECLRIGPEEVLSSERVFLEVRDMRADK
jgi:hypothetical protein